MAEEVRDCTSANVTEEAHGSPYSVPLDATAVAECEERVFGIQDVISKKRRTISRHIPVVFHRCHSTDYRWQSLVVEHKYIRILNRRCQSAGPADNIGPQERTKQVLL